MTVNQLAATLAMLDANDRTKPLIVVVRGNGPDYPDVTGVEVNEDNIVLTAEVLTNGDK